MKSDIKKSAILFTVLCVYSCNLNPDRVIESDDSTESKIIDSQPNTNNFENSPDDFYYSSIENDFPMDDESRFINADSFEINIAPKGNYKNLKSEIVIKRENFRNKYITAKNIEYKQKIIETCRGYITETLVNHIFPFWYGMPWNLAGYSAIPNEGEVGCSYFVSNTLKHCGFKVNRYKLAQQNTKNIALSIQLSDSIIVLKGNENISLVKNYFVNNKKEGLYYVGLDSHVGYLLFKKGELFFIQSNYSFPVVVLAEFTEKSDVFLSNQYYIADISWNNELIRKWIMGEEIVVIKK